MGAVVSEAHVQRRQAALRSLRPGRAGRGRGQVKSNLRFARKASKFSTGDLFLCLKFITLLAIPCVRRLHRSVRRGTWCVSFAPQ